MSKRFPALPAAPPASSASTQASMKGNRSRGTWPESELARVLVARGLTDYVANDPAMPGTPDFVFYREKVAVFVHGCYWHRCPYCRPNFPKSNVDYWTAKFRRNRYRDAQNRSSLRAIGWRSIVVWECVLRKNPTRVGARIQRHLKQSRG